MGSATTSSRVITVNDGGTLYWSTNNALISGSGPNASTAPTIQLNGSTLFATNYNAIGNVQLNGGTLAQNSGASGSYQGYDLLGTITVDGSAPSLISAGSTNRARSSLPGDHRHRVQRRHNGLGRARSCGVGEPDGRLRRLSRKRRIVRNSAWG